MANPLPKGPEGVECEPPPEESQGKPPPKGEGRCEPPLKEEGGEEEGIK